MTHPVVEPLVGDDTLGPVDSGPFLEIEVHPDLWVLDKIPTLVEGLPAEVLDGMKTELQAILDGLKARSTVDGEDPADVIKDDLERALYGRSESLRVFGGEISSQSGNFQGYYHSLLSLNSRQFPATMRLIALVYGVAGIVGMKMKLHFMRARPVQVWPGLFPVLPTPPHPSYPSNHATQAYSVSKILGRVLTQTKRAGTEEHVATMSERIARNREYAGLHFASDTAAGDAVSTALIDHLADQPLVQDLMARAILELGIAE
ncbi:hypothetical protein J7443_05180 [Tropicibacter sp. R15_0]|uniref:phosphatase PAP2 family protein n=1 Tax=Tropicibacter sp. R15_0 TaxID=2821101 RepID=UPI001ADB3693|nr:phosphatase PAP2 family protein [Tropicibacter sp. R15_0]MBO9464613.1 hypothetical protein [Tropicibacter sp. R15_0]